MSILSTREWATLIWGLLFLVYIMCHKEIRKSFWKVIVIFFDKKLRILWEIILLYVLAITMILYLKERLRINSNWILDYCQETMIKIEKEISEDKCKVYS